MSISYAEDLYIVDLDCQTCDTPTDMSLSSINSPTASVIDLDNDQTPPSPIARSDPSIPADVDQSSNFLILDSFIPILRCLGHGFYLDQNLYYIGGSIMEDDWARLRAYCRTVSKFILTDKDSEGQISPAAFLRLARLQKHNMPLLPRLSDLVITEANASITFLDLLLTPSLRSLEVSCIPDTQQPTFFAFLTAIEEEAPFLQTLILGPGQFPPNSLQAISKFNNLRHLELKLGDTELPFAFFDNIGSLPNLETLILDARYVSNTRIENRSDKSSVSPASKDMNSFLSNNFPNPNPVDNTQNKEICHTSILPSGTFNQLAKLHIIGWLPVLEDLFHRITSARLEDVSVTFIRLSHDELKVHLAKEKAEQDIRDEERQKRDEAEKKRKEVEKLWRDEMERKRVNEEKKWREEAENKRRKEEKRWRETNKGKIDVEIGRPNEIYSGPADVWKEVPSADTPASEYCGPTIKSAIRKGNKRGVSVDPEKPLMKLEAQKTQEELERERLLKEQDGPASLSFDAHTASFIEILQTLSCRWAAPLKRVSISQLVRVDGSFECLSKPPTLPKEMFQTLLLLPAIENLDFKGWILDSAESVLSVAESINLRSLLLPLDDPNFGVSLFTLRRVAESCPNLETFQCHIQSPESIPEYPIPTTEALSHGLRTLSVGSSSPLPTAKRLSLIARHLYLLFPNLEMINTSEEHNMEQWATVNEFVKLFQTARMDDMNRPPSRSVNRT